MNVEKEENNQQKRVTIKYYDNDKEDEIVICDHLDMEGGFIILVTHADKTLRFLRSENIVEIISAVVEDTPITKIH